jgi:uncharacterized protein YjbI with pentapeptide repeats
MSKIDISGYDWAAAILAIASSDTKNLGHLAKTAGLDPLAGDLSDVDFSGLDLSRQDFGGWDLRNAKFTGARLDGAKLRSARVDPENVAEAVGWEKAELDDAVRTAVEKAAAQRNSLFDLKVDDLKFSLRTSQCLQNDGITHIGQIVQRTEADMIRIPNFGRKSLIEIREALLRMGLRFGMTINWPVVTNN